jgi:hypothetical protein
MRVVVNNTSSMLYIEIAACLLDRIVFINIISIIIIIISTTSTSVMIRPNHRMEPDRIITQAPSIACTVVLVL